MVLDCQTSHNYLIVITFYPGPYQGFSVKLDEHNKVKVFPEVLHQFIHVYFYIGDQFKRNCNIY